MAQLYSLLHGFAGHQKAGWLFQGQHVCWFRWHGLPLRCYQLWTRTHLFQHQSCPSRTESKNSFHWWAPVTFGLFHIALAKTSTNPRCNIRRLREPINSLPLPVHLKAYHFDAFIFLTVTSSKRKINENDVTHKHILIMGTWCCRIVLFLPTIKVRMWDPAHAKSLTCCFVFLDDQEWHGGIRRSWHSDSGWHFWRWYWLRQHRGGRVLLPTTPADKKKKSIAAGLWSEKDWRGRKAWAASHPPIARGLWLWLPCVLWSRNVHLQPGRHQVSGKDLPFRGSKDKSGYTIL